MSHNMSIYRRLNPRLLVQAGLGLGLLYWANICLIYISNMLNKIINISNAMYYTMLCMLEWMRKGKHRIGTPRTRGLHGSALTAYIHEGIP